MFGNFIFLNNIDGNDTYHQDKQLFVRPQEVNGTHVPIIIPPSSQSYRRGSGNNNSNHSGNGSNSTSSSFRAKTRVTSKQLSRERRSSSEPYPTGSIIPRKYLLYRHL